MKILVLVLGLGFSACSSGDLFSFNELTNDTLEITGFAEGKKSGFSESTLVIPEKLQGKTVTRLGYRAFSEILSLRKVVLPPTLIEIGSSVFENCSNLEEINLPDNLKIIELMAFHKDRSLKQISLPRELKALGSWSFSDCVSLETISLPPGIKEIPEGLVHGALGLKSIRYSLELTGIGSYAFGQCPSLEVLRLPKTLKTIGRGGLSTGSHKLRIEVDEKNPWFVMQDDGLFNKEKTTILWCNPQKSGHYAVPDSVEVLGVAAFSDCEKLESLTLGPKLRLIGLSAVDRCPSLKLLEILSPRAPELEGQLLDVVSYKPRILVPRQALESYQTQESWAPYGVLIQEF